MFFFSLVGFDKKAEEERRQGPIAGEIETLDDGSKV